MKVLTDAMAKVPEADKSKPDSIAKVIREHCKDTRNKDHKFVSFFDVHLFYHASTHLRNCG